VTRFRPGSTATLAALAALLFATSGCDINAFCFQCESSSATGGQAGGAQGGSGGDGGDGGSIIDTMGSGGSLDCMEDILTDPQNCGACGNVCNLPNAFPKCEAGFCVIDMCAGGFVDLDKQVANGCEYKCAPSAGGVEICDTLDNDCNGLVDELTDLQSDPQSCGACNITCTFANATGECASGMCVIGECLVGYSDLNMDAADGCEYQCTITNNGVEVCDYADNDCDGTSDEGFDLQTDPANCGACGTDCGDLYPGSIGTCTAGVCGFGPCEPGFIDLDGIEANGCEYACMPGGAEVCDGQDNDCNGLEDDGVLPGVGATCGVSNVGECLLGAQDCQGGMLVCVGAVGPSAELCDGMDNDCTGANDEGCPVANASDKRLDLGAGSAVGQATSTQLAAAQLGDVILASYIDRRSGNADIRATVSTDGGVTWPAADLDVATGALVQVEPWSFLGPTRAYVAYAQFPVAAHRDVYVSRAAAPYTTFAAPVRADKDATSADAFLVRGVVAQPGAAQDTIVVVWQSLSGTGANVTTNVYLQRSLDSGQTWLAQDLRVNAVLGKAELPAMASDGNGKVFLAWRDLRNGLSEVYADVYDATAGTLLGNTALSAGNAAEQITVAADPGGPNVYVAWTDLRAAKKVIRLNRSTNAGATFAADGAVVNVDSTFADASNPAVAATAGRVAVAWEDTRSGLADIRVNHSENAGATWLLTTPRADLGTVPGTSASIAPSIAFGAGARVFVTWEDARNGKRDIYANHSFDQGTTFQPIDLRLDVGNAGAPSPLGAADSRSPFIVTSAAGTRAVTLWIDYRTAAGTDGVNGDIYTNLFQ
jgi:Notch-like protein